MPLRVDGSLELAVVADTHSSPHPNLEKALGKLMPDAILHAGDIGDLKVLDGLAQVAPVHAVRGNIDVRAPDLPDVLLVDIVRSAADDTVVLRILLMHIALYGPKLRAEVARRARKAQAGLVVCGHSHIPFMGKEGKLSVFNPGSAGPRRFSLPIVFGRLSLGRSRAGTGAAPGEAPGPGPAGERAMRLEHFDLETGGVWSPPGLRSVASPGH